MKLMCTNASHYWLTVGKVYDAEVYSSIHDRLFTYSIINDIGRSHAVEGFLFIELHEYRQQKLNELIW